MWQARSLYRNLRLSFKKMVVLAFTTVMVLHHCLLMHYLLIFSQNIVCVEPIVIIRAFLLLLYLQGQMRYIPLGGIDIMEQHKLKRKKVVFVIVVALIFILPLVAISKTVLQITSVAHRVTTSNTKIDTISTPQPVIPPGSDWSMYLHDPQRTAATDERVLSTTNAGQLSKLWTFKTGGVIAASAAVVNGTV